MNRPAHPANILYAGGRQFPALAACEHYAGSEKLILKALERQAELAVDGTSIFDITADCEDGAPTGQEHAHAALVGDLIASSDNRYLRLGARIHDVRHPCWRDDLDTIIAKAGQRLAYLVLPKPENLSDVERQVAALEAARIRNDIARPIPVHVLIETPGALHDAWRIAAMPQVESIDFGLMDFVSAHHGAIPASAMRSPGQFDHPLIIRAKCEIAAAALANGVVPAHNVTTEFRDTSVVAADARRARESFGFLRMWSIHPNQIEPIVDAMRPAFAEVEEASNILLTASAAQWGPIQIEGRLHDRASYRYYWELLQRAHSTGVALPHAAREQFFAESTTGGEARP
jgi:citrate lyase subunit beta/citryl-CoA lyase